MAEPRDMTITKITVKYSIIDISQVPEVAKKEIRQRGFWTALFESIPEGKAAVIARTEKLPRTVYGSFAQWRAGLLRKGFSVPYKFRTDKKNIYIIHEKDSSSIDAK